MPADGSNPPRESADESHHGAPAVGAVVRDRFETHEVFQRITVAADEEATTSDRELFFSGLAAGFGIVVIFFLSASLTAATDDDPVMTCPRPGRRQDSMAWA